VNYGFERAKWNPFLAATLSEDLASLGAAKDGAALTIGLVSVKLEDRALNQAFYAEMTVRAATGTYSKDYVGSYESMLNFGDAARRAAADALKRVVEDEELEARCRR
jgi:hypothetical protein